MPKKNAMFISIAMFNTCLGYTGFFAPSVYNCFHYFRFKNKFGQSYNKHPVYREMSPC